MSESDTATLVKKTIEAFGQLDILVNNAGVLEMGWVVNFSDTLFEIFIFSPKIQLWFPGKIVDFFLVEKLVKMLGFWSS